MADDPKAARDRKSGFPAYEPSGRWNRDELVASGRTGCALAAAGGAIFQVGSDFADGGFAAVILGTIAFLVMVVAPGKAIRATHCRNSGAGAAFGAALGASYVAGSWIVALVNADLFGDGLAGAFAARVEMRDMPWITWAVETGAFVLATCGSMSAEAESPYCEDVGAWAESHRLGVARTASVVELRRAIRDGDLAGLFAASREGAGSTRARFELLTAPGSREQFLRVVELQKQKNKAPSDDDSGTNLVDAAVLSTEEREALESVFGGPPAA